MAVGILAYGAYVPRFRIRSDEIARVWGDDANVGAALNVHEKSVPGPDEDTATLAVEAARQCMARAAVSGAATAADIGAIYVGSESHPYAVKPTGTIVQAALDAPATITMADFEFACKAATAAVQVGMAMTKSGMAKSVLAIGADTSQSAPRDALEYSASAGAAAFLIGTDKKHIVAELGETVSVTSDTPDFWRREGQRYPRHGERFTGQPAYFRHVEECSRLLMENAGTAPDDYTHCVFHQPNGKFPAAAAARLGFKPDQWRTGLLAPRIGNTYSAAVLLGLVNILDSAEAGDRIFMCGYGSGAGSDAFDVTVTKHIEDFARDGNEALESQLRDTVTIDYATYAKYRSKIVAEGP
jgi:hydroxymethylglutaryl-CoA synthase